MQIITLGSVAGEGDDGLYQGIGYLFRFAINSVEQFFEKELPFIKNKLNIDIRQVMRLELLAGGNSGLDNVLLLVSAQEGRCTQAQIESLDLALGKISESTPYRDSDAFRRRLIEFLRVAPAAQRARLMKAIAATNKLPRRSQREYAQAELAASGVVCRVLCQTGPPTLCAWRDLVFESSERMRNSFREESLDRVLFTAIPNSEEEYRAEADLILKRPPKTFKSRTKLRFRKPANVKVKTTISLDDIGPEEDRLPPAERRALSSYDRLDTQARLLLWQLHLSKFYS